jgi:protein-L-isoaspartate(D-aspartate) O-methyltransferase
MTALHKSSLPDTAAARLNMIEGQLRPNGVRDERILSAMESLPRERFVPPPLSGIACIDEELPVSASRFLLRPMVLARLVQAANITTQDRVLDIGSGTGYSTGLIAGLAKEVIALEADANLQKLAASNLEALGIHNVEFHTCPLGPGLPSGAPYNVILVNGGMEIMPEVLLAQLAEGGRLVAVVRHYGPAHAAHTGEARLYERRRGQTAHRVLFDATAELLPDFAAPKTFSF